jgi:Cof subfamily protein (haloacid dehalogenase superfamily)
MAYRLIGIDLDETLLDDTGHIPPRAAKAITQAAQQGAYVVICTARTKTGAQRFYDSLGLRTYFITSGGAEVFDPDGQVVFSRPVDPPLVKELLMFAYANDVHAQVYVDGDLIYREKNEHAVSYEMMYGFPGIEMPDILELDDLITPKVLFVVGKDRIASFQRQVEETFPTLAVRQSKPMYLEVTHSGISKGLALAYVAKAYGIDRQEVIAVGDTEVDISMLEFAGLGVAVANADKELKKIADIVCASNNDGGVADVITQYILEA